MSLLLAVDVGGSGMRCVVQRDGAPGPVRRAAGIRISTGGVTLPELITSAGELTTGDLAGGTPDVVCFAARSFTTLAEPAAVLAAVQRLGGRRTVLCADAVSSLVGAVGAVRPAAVVAAGTGAIAFGTDFAGTVRRVDGWGHVLGDRGSAAWLGLQALRALLAAADRGEPWGALGAAVEQQVGPLMTWSRQVMTRADAPELLGAIAPLVTAAAEADALAASLCRRAGEELAASLLAAAAPLPTSAVLAVNGGVLAVPQVREPFDAALAAAGRRADDPRGSSLDGALLLATAVAQGSAPSALPPYLLLG